MFNIADVAVLAVIAIGVAIGAYRGFLISLLKMFSSVISLALTGIISPVLTAVARKTFVYSMILKSVSNKLAIDMSAATTKTEQSQLIDSLAIPQIIKNCLLENNNNVVYNILGADTIGDYIANYIANIITEVIIFVATFVIVLLIIAFIMRVCRILCKIPVIKQCNAIGGGIIGGFYSIVFIWIVFAVLNVFLLRPGFVTVADTIKNSAVASIIYDNDILIKLFFSPKG
jgi:hypothetical protein